MAIILDQLKGLADSKWSGIKGSVAACVGLDIHSTPGLIQVHQKLTKNSGTTVDAFCKVAVAASNGYSFWFSSTSGKIWARASTGTWTLAYTTVAGAGTHGCLGAEEYNGYIYWATQSRLHRVTIAGADDSWAAGAVSLDWATFEVTNASWHPMVIQDLTLFIGDGNQVALVDENGVFDGNALDIKTPNQIKCMKAYGWDLLLGTYISDSIPGEVVTWDTVSPSWDVADPIAEPGGINAFIQDDNYVYVNAGLAGNIYFFNGEKLEPYKRIPGTYSSTKYGSVHPNSVGCFRGIPIFGFSNGTGNPAPQGVYSLGSYSRDYAKVLDLSWVNSQGLTNSQEIGAVLVLGFNLMVAWKDDTNYGVDAIDYSAKYASAYFETRMLFQDKRDMVKTLAEVAAYYNSLPANTGITFSYSVNGAAYVAMTSVTDTDINAVKADLSVSGVGSLQIKVAFTVSTNDAPTMEALGIDLE